MKLAGAKNQGAWFRFNKWLMKGRDGGPQTDTTKTALKAALAASGTLNTLYIALAGIAADAGVGGFPASKEDLLTQWMLHGIPLQVWMGKLSWTEYDKVGTGASAVYIPRGQSEAHYFGVDCRRVCRHFQASLRELSDVMNASTNNPGGYPDDVPVSMEP